MSSETPPPPVISGRPVEVATGVFVIPDVGVGLVPNVGVIVGEHAALVVHAGLGPRNGAIVRAIAEDLAGELSSHASHGSHRRTARPWRSSGVDGAGSSDRRPGLAERANPTNV
jgi:hypothetical protein